VAKRELFKLSWCIDGPPSELVSELNRGCEEKDNEGEETKFQIVYGKSLPVRACWQKNLADHARLWDFSGPHNRDLDSFKNTIRIGVCMNTFYSTLFGNL
jgi:hypothetical protein